MNPDPRELCFSGDVSKNELQLRKKSVIQKTEVTDLSKPNSESIHSSRLLAKQGLNYSSCVKYINFEGKASSKKERNCH